MLPAITATQDIADINANLLWPDLTDPIVASTVIENKANVIIFKALVCFDALSLVDSAS
ncbi:hypothetical protein Barba20S_gp045 [Rheinheimera phage vB_RspM_Barba20S]|jgi:hypothetical protein|uniref:Uncharacterized protein n=1 Tax=Rheinheimera phage vB_RspM_Barba20S TaxID=2565662 RepID=A0A4V1F020_9CAUD|nr:hypothetical protein Barba20S_gp045 [Rheinheimera phage vB_RspM_Barba20S]